MDRHKVVIEYSANVGGYAAEARRLRTEIEALNASIMRSRAASATTMAGVTKDFNTNLGAMKQWTTGAVAMEAQGLRLGKSIEQNNLTMARQKQLLKDYRNGVVGARGAVSELAKEQVRMSRSVVNFYDDANGKRMASVSTPGGIDFKQQATQLAVARQEMQIYNRVLAQNAESTINWGKNTQWAGRQIMVGMTIPLMMMGAAAKNVFIDIDKELTRLGKVYGGDIKGVSDQAVAGIKDSVKGLGKELASEWGVSMKETIGLAADVAATGKEGNDLLVSTREAMRLSVLGEVDRQEALKATLSLQSAFKLSNEELVDSVNLLNAVENQTSTSLADLSTAIPKAGPVVKALGGDVGDLAAMLVAMKEGGIQAAEGANAIKSGLASMINPTKQAQEVAKGLGIDLQGIVDKNQGKLMPTMLEFQKALMGLDEFKRAKLIETIFGKYQFARISALFENLNSEGSQSLEVFKLMAGSSADLAKTADTEMKRLTESTSMRWQRTLETFKANLAPLGEAVTKVFTGVLNAVNVVLEAFGKLPGPVKAFIGAVAGLAALVGPILMIAGIFGNFIGQMMKGFAVLRGKKFGVFELLTKDIVAANAATGHLVDVQFSEQKALMEINAVMERQIELLRELAAGQQAVAAGAPSVAQPPVIPTPADRGALNRQARVQVDYGQQKWTQDATGLEAGWMAANPAIAQGYAARVDEKLASGKATNAMDRVLGAMGDVPPETFDRVGEATRDAMAASIERTQTIDPDFIDQSLRQQFPDGLGRDVASAVSASLYHSLETPLANVPDDLRERIQRMPEVNRKGIGTVYQDLYAYGVGKGVSPATLPGAPAAGHVNPHADRGAAAPSTASLVYQSKPINSAIGDRELTPGEHQTGYAYAPGPNALAAYVMQKASPDDLVSAAGSKKSPTRAKFVEGLDEQARATFATFEKEFGKGRVSVQALQDAIQNLSGASRETAATVAKEIVAESAASNKVSASRKAAAEASSAVLAAEGKLRAARKAAISAGNLPAGRERAWAEAAARQEMEAAKIGLAAARQNERTAAFNRVLSENEARNSAVNDQASKVQKTAADTQQRAAQVEASTAGATPAQIVPGGSVRGGRMSNFARSAEGQTMGLGMGAMGVGMLTGNEAANKAGMALSAVSMITMGFNAISTAVMPRFTAAVLAASGAASRFALSVNAGGVRGGIKSLSGGLMGMVRVINPAAVGLGLVAAAGYIAYNSWKKAEERQKAEKRNDSTDWDLFGLQKKTFAERAAFGNQKSAVSKDEETQIKDSAGFQGVKKDVLGARGPNAVARSMETRYRANLASAQANAKQDEASQKAAKERVDKFYEILAKETNLVAEWKAMKDDAGKNAGGVQKEEADRVIRFENDLKAWGEAQARYDELSSKLPASGGDGLNAAEEAERNRLEGLLQGYEKTYASINDLKNQLDRDFASTAKAAGQAAGDAFAAGATGGQALEGFIANMNDFRRMMESSSNDPAKDLQGFKDGLVAADATLGPIIQNLTSVDAILAAIAVKAGLIPNDIVMNIQFNATTPEWAESQILDWVKDFEAGESAWNQEIAETNTVFASTAATAVRSKEAIGKAYDKQTESIQDANEAAQEAHEAEQQASEDRIDGLNDEIDKRNDKIDAVQKNIDKINDEAEAQKKALELAKESADFQRDQQKSEINYYDALSRGDYVGAANIRSDMEQNSSDYQYNRAGEGVDNDTDKKVAKEEKKIEKYESEIKGIEGKIEAIEKMQQASDRAFAAAQKQRQKAVEQREEDKKAYINAEFRKSEVTAKAELDKRAEAKKTYDQTMTNLHNLISSGQATDKEVRTIVGNARAEIAKTLGWTPAQTKKFGDDMADSLLKAYDNVIQRAGITKSEFTQMTGRRRVVNPNTGAVSYTNKTVNHKGAYVRADHTSGKDGAKGDEVDRRLQVGEYVIRKEAVAKYGQGHFANLNNMKMHTGGAVNGGVAGLSMKALAGERSMASDILSRDIVQNVFQPKVDALKAQMGGTSASGDAGVSGDYGPPDNSGNAANTQRAINFVRSKWGVYSGGYRSIQDGGDHPRGKALDAMTSNVGKGTEIADWFLKNPKEFGTKYVIWRQAINNLQRGGGWRQMEDRGSPTQNHMDHVHVSLLKKGAHIKKDGGLQSLHKGETVLTAPLSESLKQGIKGIREIPATIGRGNGGGGSTVNEGDKQINVNVYAQPGMDIDDLANEMERRVERAAARVGVWG